MLQNSQNWSNPHLDIAIAEVIQLTLSPVFKMAIFLEQSSSVYIINVQQFDLLSLLQGGMKRHGFKGMPASHGASLSHRSIGSTGQRDAPGRVCYITVYRIYIQKSCYTSSLGIVALYFPLGQAAEKFCYKSHIFLTL